MTQPAAPIVEHLPTSLPAIRRVPNAACLIWLHLGLADLRVAWAVSLAHGVLFAGLGWLTHGWRDPPAKSSRRFWKDCAGSPRAMNSASSPGRSSGSCHRPVVDSFFTLRSGLPGKE
ncbi:MAG: hypothetical protein M1547_08425 [Gammaproteobacteria bacterium]|nr:hypothetical protein [Gammaproteobacteria bacterium]